MTNPAGYDEIVTGRRSIRGFRCFDGIADDHRARQIAIAKQLFGAMGWPDSDFPANAVISNRKSVDEAVRFVGFD